VLADPNQALREMLSAAVTSMLNSRQCVGLPGASEHTVYRRRVSIRIDIQQCRSRNADVASSGGPNASMNRAAAF